MSLHTTDPVLDIEGLSVPGRVDDVSLQLSAGAVALVGANGAGKSSLLHVLAGRLRPRAGRVRIAGVAPRDEAAASLRAYVPQQVDLPAHLRAGEVLAAAARARSRTAEDARDAADRMGVTDLLDRPVGRLSGGMLQRLALAAGLIGTPPVWLLDEPASALDAGGLERLTAWAETHVAAGGTVLASAHRPEEVDAFARDAVLMKHGRIAGHLPVAELFVVEDADGRPLPAGAGLRRRPGPRLRSVLEGDDAD